MIRMKQDAKSTIFGKKNVLFPFQYCYIYVSAGYKWKNVI